MQFFLFSIGVFFIPLLLNGAEVKDILLLNALVFDVGAHVGDKTAYYLSNQVEKIICIEPHPEVLIDLRNRYQNESRVVIEPMGLSDTEGVGLFFPGFGPSISTMSSDWKLGRFKNDKWGPGIWIPVTTLDNMIKKYGVPDFCKIDVEGFEWNVLMGLTYRIPYISFEFVKEFLDKKTKPCLDRLIELGFERFNVMFAYDVEFFFEQWIDSEVLFSFLKNLEDDVSWGDIYAH